MARMRRIHRFSDGLFIRSRRHICRYAKLMGGALVRDTYVTSTTKMRSRRVSSQHRYYTMKTFQGFVRTCFCMFFLESDEEVLVLLLLLGERGREFFVESCF